MDSKEKKISLILAEPHTFCREAFTDFINRENGFIVKATARDGNELVKLYCKDPSSIIISEIYLPSLSGLEAVYQLSRKYPDIKCIFLSSLDTELFVSAAIRAGARGLVSKDMSPGELFYSIEAVSKGKFCFLGKAENSLCRWQPLLEQYDADGCLDAYYKPVDLNDLDKQIIYFNYKELERKEISDKISISIPTIDKHLKQILTKFKMKNYQEIYTFLLKMKPELLTQ